MNPPASSVGPHLLKVSGPLEFPAQFSDSLLLLEPDQELKTRLDHRFLGLEVAQPRGTPYQRVVNQNVNPHSRFFDV
jgi:hypothetical protein